MILTWMIFVPSAAHLTSRESMPALGADGTVVWEEGLNEKNHAGSFVHEEFHAENRVRKAVGLSKGGRRGVKAAQPLPNRQKTAGWQKKQGKNPAQYIIWIVMAIISSMF